MKRYLSILSNLLAREFRATCGFVQFIPLIISAAAAAARAYNEHKARKAQEKALEAQSVSDAGGDIASLQMPVMQGSSAAGGTPGAQGVTDYASNTMPGQTATQYVGPNATAQNESMGAKVEGRAKATEEMGKKPNRYALVAPEAEGAREVGKRVKGKKIDPYALQGDVRDASAAAPIKGGYAPFTANG